MVFVAELLISEVVTNAVLHAQSPVEVVLSDPGGALHVEVIDESDMLPVLVEPVHSIDDHGRGLLLVRDLSEQWGVVENDSGKTVWFSLPRGADYISNPEGWGNKRVIPKTDV